MRCDEVMKREVVCAKPGDTVEDAARLMKLRNVGFLPVCDDEGSVYGTLTDRDIVVRVVAQGHPPNTTVREAMTHEVVACAPTDDIRMAERLMARNHKSRILVLDGEKLVGVISLSDIAEKELDQRRTAETMKGISERET